jgi:Phage integrase, N-terminal SAM-like domain
MTGTYIDAAAGKVKFSAYAEQWRGMQVHRQATSALTERAMRLYVNPVIGDLPLASIRPAHVQQLVRQLCDELAPTTVHVTYGYVASIFKSAVRPADRPHPVRGHPPACYPPAGHVHSRARGRADSR